jgi:putative transcriptional regulator
MITFKLEKLLAGQNRSLYWLNRKTRIRWATLAKMAHGKARRIEVSALDKICRELNCQVGDLLVRVERRTKTKRADLARKR